MTFQLFPPGAEIPAPLSQMVTHCSDSCSKPAKVNQKKPSSWLTRESGVARSMPWEKDNTKAVIQYMLDRGAFSGWMVDGRLPYEFQITPCTESLPWNPAAPKRIVRLELREKVNVYSQTKRGRGTFSHVAHELRETVDIPHWDYDGVDPLVAREPYDRQVAHNWIDQDVRNRDIRGVWSNYDVDHDVRQYEACEHLTEYHNGIEGAAQFSYCTGPEG